ncbi:lipoprotein [compost metagenome]
MEEVYSNKEKDSTIWQPRKADPELETEFLRRIMVKLGVSEEQSKAIAAAPLAPVTTSKIATQNGAPVLEVADPFDRTWRRVGLALDRTGFTVEDRDRSQGIYYVRYIDPTDLNKKQDGFFAKIFNRNPDAPEPIKYRIQVKSDNATSVVSVLSASGQADTSANAQRIVKVLADDMK